MDNKIIIGAVGLLAVGTLCYFIFTPPRTTNTLTEPQAIQEIIKLHPELASYQTTSLPPSSIETKQAADGWYVSFIQRGSGVPGVLHALCYRVTNPTVVTLVGTYPGQSEKVVDRIEFETCAPVFAQQPASSTPQAKCYVGGCSAQLCSDSPGAVSDCIYNPTYSCYKNATCERQSDGQCGWTPTAELNSCLEQS